MHLLLVEDDAMSRELWALLLEAEGHEVWAAESGEAALALLEAAQGRPSKLPEIVLTDMQLPGLCGAPLAVAMRGLCGPGTMLLGMSGSFPREHAQEAYDAFLLKPFTMEALVERIAGHTTATAERRAVVEAPGVEAPGVETPREASEDDQGADALEDALDEAVYASLLRSMPAARVEELYGLCLADARGRIERMRAAVAAGDGDGYRKGAHAIKGGCGMVGAKELQRLAGRMEQEGLDGTVDGLVDGLADGLGDGLGDGAGDGLGDGAAGGDGILAVTAMLDQFDVACTRLEGMLVTRRSPA
jgi:CheY-like chemotaxis protein/HPt (histidine-containing phosphotransfer) domain-containing protein